MPPPPAPTMANSLSSSAVNPAGDTVTRQSAMNPQGIYLFPLIARKQIDNEFVHKVGAGAAARRRSNVVKEVERLEKNREERRARQAEIKEEKKAMMNIDPGNPNCEFLSMIK